MIDFLRFIFITMALTWNFYLGSAYLTTDFIDRASEALLIITVCGVVSTIAVIIDSFVGYLKND